MATTYGKDYVDFDMDFDKHPAHGDLGINLQRVRTHPRAGFLWRLARVSQRA